ncbi:MAG: type I-B CRISPR-associated protein Cas5 [Epsilonproteobacteria bacterium]|nr:type I-B CRISPR-associated protein Cas5 [Campylobacterota bacterium]NPA56160.1 type I-B CRISPR-associated protein Cas5 [Campylobacterota bacterium]
MIGERALVFDLKGSIAHFRAYYTNASSMSYLFPPRTVLIGVLAAILGYKRDTYYHKLSPDQVRLALEVAVPMRKSIQSVNYVRSTKSEGFGTFSQALKLYLERQNLTYPTPLELVLPRDGLELIYRIYLWSSDGELYRELRQRIREGRSFYPLYLGISEFLADLEWKGEFPIEEADRTKGVRSVIPESLFPQIDFSCPASFVLEKMPLHFVVEESGMRRIEGVGQFICERNCQEISMRGYKGIYSIDGRNVVWLET